MSFSEKKTISESLGDAISMWEDLTGIELSSRSWTWGSMDIGRMNDMLKEAMRLDQRQETPYLMLEVFLRDYLEEKSFTAAQIMRDYRATSNWLGKAEKLFSILQSDLAVELGAGFRARVMEGLKRYGADPDRLAAAVEDPDTLPFLRLHALRSMQELKAHQFLRGEPAEGPPQVLQHVYLSWNVNDLLAGLRDMPVSGIAVVMLRDPAHPDRSYFGFAMRNGGNVILFVDRKRPVYPGQEDVLARRGGRGAARRFATRKDSNHFPYQIIDTSTDERGDLQFNEETAPVQAGKNLVPLMRIVDLPADQAIWITMMLSLIAEKFWRQNWQAEALSYTGAMVRNKSLLVTSENGEKLPAAQGYRPIGLDDIEIDDLTFTALDSQVMKHDRQPHERVNAWIEERYRDRIDREVVNQWSTGADVDLFLPGLKTTPKWLESSNRIEVTHRPGGVMEITKNNNGSSLSGLRGYALQSFSATEFGTEEELREDRIFIARQNMAQALQREADIEFDSKKDEILDWWEARLQANFRAILALIARGEDDGILYARGFGKFTRRFMAIGDIDKDSGDRWSDISFGERPRTSSARRNCVITGAAASRHATFTPRNHSDLALLAGIAVDDLPVFLRNWDKDDTYVGNHLLNRIDPVESKVRDPWKKLKFTVSVYLSKSGMKKLQTGLAESRIEEIIEDLEMEHYRGRYGR